MKTPIPFVPFRRHQPIGLYQSNRIPHWRQDDCTYFVTFRLGDSLPEATWRKIEESRRIWLEERGGDFEKLSNDEVREFESRFALLLDDSLDQGLGSCILGQSELRAVVESAFKHLDEDKARVGDFVIMPNHVHALMTPREDVALEIALKSLKSFTAKEINRMTERSGSLWQRDSFDHIVRDADELARFQDYIANNPIKAGLPDRAYTHSRSVYEW